MRADWDTVGREHPPPCSFRDDADRPFCQIKVQYGYVPGNFTLLSRAQSYRGACAKYGGTHGPLSSAPVSRLEISLDASLAVHKFIIRQWLRLEVALQVTCVA
jgi:hypothetical protein